MNAPAPGWHPDPGGCWDERWWDGQEWTIQVRTGVHQAEDSYPPQPMNPDRSQVIWVGQSQAVRAGDESYHLTWDTVNTVNGRGTVTEQVPVWGIRSIEVRTSAAHHARGIGDVVLEIAYAGYFGPSTYVLRAVPDPHHVKATVRRQIGIWNTFR